jgi:cytoskeletal protein CcmA (bactofilin family)
MNKILGGVLLSLLALSALVLPVHAAGFKAGDTYTLRAGEVFQGNLYAAGGTVDIGGEVRGDLYAAGGTVNVNGAIKGDLVVLGGTVIVNGPVSGDIRVVGGNLMLNSAAEGELVAAGGTINLTSGSKVAGDCGDNATGYREDRRPSIECAVVGNRFTAVAVDHCIELGTVATDRIVHRRRPPLSQVVPDWKRKRGVGISGLGRPDRFARPTPQLRLDETRGIGAKFFERFVGRHRRDEEYA